MTKPRFRVTRHARDRAKERLNVSYHAEVNKEYKNAIRYGHPIVDYDGDFLKFLKYKKAHNKRKNIGIKVYKDVVFIYNGRVMITSYKVPEKFKPTSNYLKNKNKKIPFESEHISNLYNTYGIDNVVFEVIKPDKTCLVYKVNLYINEELVSCGTGKKELKAKNSAIKIHLNNLKTKNNSKESE